MWNRSNLTTRLMRLYFLTPDRTMQIYVYMLCLKFQQFKSTITRNTKMEQGNRQFMCVIVSDLFSLLTQRQNSSLPNPVLLFHWRTRRVSPGCGWAKLGLMLPILRFEFLHVSTGANPWIKSVTSWCSWCHDWSFIFYPRTGLHASYIHSWHDHLT